ncbi:hypothetical protein GCM10022234_08590 [Aeromicrobium panaciterrae]|uniref:type II toxin-antitoxin system VapC family toxin n=1 Tax=Aeromicrobium panaciterrae TaxID=363861 RepID=UPI0031E2E064
MIVIDASVWATALADSGEIGQVSRDALRRDPDWWMPAHGPTEVLRTLRRFELAGHLTPDEATRAATEVTTSSTRYAIPDTSMLVATWSLRHNISLYDAPYVVLAAMHGCPLVTRDAKLATAARAKGVQVIEPGTQLS